MGFKKEKEGEAFLWTKEDAENYTKLTIDNIKVSGGEG
jgi:hypothetical protein